MAILLLNPSLFIFFNWIFSFYYANFYLFHNLYYYFFSSGLRLGQSSMVSTLTRLYLDGEEMYDEAFSAVTRCKNLELFSVSCCESATDLSLKYIKVVTDWIILYDFIQNFCYFLLWLLCESYVGYLAWDKVYSNFSHFRNLSIYTCLEVRISQKKD